MIIPEISIQISANSVAWYGAILSTFGAVFSFYSLWKDRGKLKITYQKNMRVMNARYPFTEEKDYFIVHITNTGRRPIAIGNVAIQYVTGENFLLADSIDSQSTRILTEENPHTMITTDQGIVDFSKIHRIMVYDKVGKEYIKYFSKFPTFTKIAYKLKTVSNTMTFNHSKDVNIN